MEIVQLVYLAATGDLEGKGWVEGDLLFEEEDAFSKDQLITHYF